MQIAPFVLLMLSLTELLMWWRPMWALRKYLSVGLIIGLSMVSGFLLVNYISAWAVLVVILNIYRIINLLRILQVRIQPDYLYHASRKSSQWLIAFQVLVVAGAYFVQLSHVGALTGFYVLAALQIGVAGLLLASTLRHLRTTKPPVDLQGVADRDLPTLTVAVPARNETEALAECLNTLLASTYPKLEILVLDDCSQDKRTPEIIRDFAHDGVRFIAGDVPPSNWLAKNYAYAQLAKESNGDILLFCGVDTRFEPGSLTAMVKTLIQKQKTMLSILPRNELLPGLSLAQTLIQPNRYAWELSLPRRLLNRPPVLSTCWLITRDALQAAGGFEAATNKGVVESYFAQAVAKNGDGYSFLHADGELAVNSLKELDEQRGTAIRTRYPQLHRRPELVALVGLAEFTLLLWPWAIAIVAFATNHLLLGSMALFTLVLGAYTYSLVVNLTYRRKLLRGPLLLPIVTLYDIGLLNYSMWQYEFGEVIWKGRNVCLPVMRTIPHLPKL
jgi:hypothetical protein